MRKIAPIMTAGRYVEGGDASKSMSVSASFSECLPDRCGDREARFEGT
jgi:hypothetical protein